MKGIHHETVVVEHRFSSPVDRVFAAWTDSESLSRWYLPGDEGWSSQILEHDFRIGGRKLLTFGPSGQTPYGEDCRYEDIAVNELIIYTMTISQGDTRLTASLVTIEFTDLGDDTNLLMTDQLAIINGADTGEERRQGWSEVFNHLAAELA